MLQPKRVKYRRPHIIKYEGHCKSAPHVAFGEFGLQALEGSWVTTRQIEAARIVLARYSFLRVQDEFHHGRSTL